MWDYAFDIHNGGDHPLIGVHVTVYEENYENNHSKFLNKEDVGPLAPHEGRSMAFPFRAYAGSRLRIFINSQAPGMQERVEFRQNEQFGLANTSNEDPSLEYKFILVKPWLSASRAPKRLIEGKPAQILKEQDWIKRYSETDFPRGYTQKGEEQVNHP